MNSDKKGRAFWHDYRAKCIYFITMKKAVGAPTFGKIAGNPGLPSGTARCAFISLSPLGRIVKNAIYNISRIEPRIRLFQYAVMPDHVHFLLSVEQTLDESLGLVIARLKVSINNAAGQNGVFQEGYNDQILRRDRNLHDIFNYIRDNPRRLAVRRAYPDFFRRKNALRIGDNTYQAYGNFQLLEHPFMEQVVVHRADSPETRKQNRDLWLYTAANGGVLVSPFISQAEKEIRAAVEEAGGRFILITNEPMGERYKPSGRDFELCEAGRLLIISAGIGGDLSRSACLAMNNMAKILADNSTQKQTYKNI